MASVEVQARPRLAKMLRQPELHDAETRALRPRAETRARAGGRNEWEETHLFIFAIWLFINRGILGVGVWGCGGMMGSGARGRPAQRENPTKHALP